MKITLAIAAIAVAAAAASSRASAADIRVVGARDSVAMRGAMPMTAADNKVMSDDNAAMAAGAGAKVKIATADLLNKPTALINKNTLAMDNNVFVSRSNIVFSQSDRLALADALAKKVEKIVTSSSSSAPTSALSVSSSASSSSTEAHAATGMDMDMGMDKNVATAVLTKNVLRAVSGSDTDAALMTKASAVVAAKDDASARGQRIADLVRAALDAKVMRSEQTIQSDVPRGVVVMVGTKDILRQPTAAVNKNVVVTDTQVAVSRSHVMPSQNDNVVLAGGAKVADAVLPASAVDAQIGKLKVEGARDAVDMESAAVAETANNDNYRVGFLYNKDETAATAAAAARDGVAVSAATKEQFWGGGLGLGLGFGWRYPLGYWNLYGAGLYGGGCGLGLACGPYFYC